MTAMLRAGVGCSIAANPRTAAAEATDAALAEAGLPRAEGAICFASSTHGAAFPMILRAVASQAGTREVAGCGASGVIGGEREIESGPSVAVLVFGGGAISGRRLFAAPLRKRPAEAAREIANAARPALACNNLLCLFPDTYNFEAEPFLAALARELPGVAVVGGGSSEDGSVGETFQFCGDVVSSNSVAGMLLAGDFEVDTSFTLACTPIGGAHRVTAVRDNIVMELDGRPAFEVFSEVAGPLADDLNRALTFVFVGVPLDPRAEKIERGRYLVRNIIGASAEHGVIAVAHRPKVGDTLALALRDAERSRADLKIMLEEMAARPGFKPAFGLYFDCVSRGSGLYHIPDHDSAYIRQYLGRVPLAGFFTGCELGPIGGATGLLQYSGVLALVSERRAPD
jgi:small ligand-binding sensory domain FIST